MSDPSPPSFLRDPECSQEEILSHRPIEPVQLQTRVLEEAPRAAPLHLLSNLRLVQTNVNVTSMKPLNHCPPASPPGGAPHLLQRMRRVRYLAWLLWQHKTLVLNSLLIHLHLYLTFHNPGGCRETPEEDHLSQSQDVTRPQYSPRHQSRPGPRHQSRPQYGPCHQSRPGPHHQSRPQYGPATSHTMVPHSHTSHLCFWIRTHSPPSCGSTL